MAVGPEALSESPYSVLVVDDSTVERQLVGGLLAQDPGCTLRFAVDGSDALEQLLANPPDIVLTDLIMPNVNGLELVRLVRERQPLLPVILMTARGSEEVAVEALQAGAASYIPKRRLARDLHETLQRVLRAAHEERGVSRLMERMYRSEQEFVIENDVQLISSLVNYLQQSIRGLRFGHEADRIRVGVALEEAMVNAFYHGNLEVSSSLRETDYQGYYRLARQRCHESPFRDRRIHVHVSLTGDEARYVIRDEGPGFDRAHVPNPIDPGNLDRPCGRGLLLIQTFMDEVRFNDAGNEITLIKRLISENLRVSA